MFYLRYLCLFAYSGVQHILCCVFLRLVCPMLAVSLDCPFLIDPSVFYDAYLELTNGLFATSRTAYAFLFALYCQNVKYVSI